EREKTCGPRSIQRFGLAQEGSTAEKQQERIRIRVVIFALWFWFEFCAPAWLLLVTQSDDGSYLDKFGLISE
ncbi:hypothetical protein A2U01_0024041, partial [Trifolium medium]|nr:hypothetical protein [Trifolium medium]